MANTSQAYGVPACSDAAYTHTSQSGEALQGAGEFEQKVEQARALLIQNPLCRSALYRILVLCTSSRYGLEALEATILGMPEYTNLTQPPYALIEWLVDAGALELFELDGEGAEVTNERKQDLSLDEIDDLVAAFAFETSEVGKVVLEELKPTNRLEELLLQVPERSDTYAELLEFLREPRSFAEIDELLRGRDILMLGREANDRPLQPSIFVDKLAAVGSIVYSNGWKITEEGEEFLEGRG